MTEAGAAIELLDDPEAADSAAEALYELGEAAIPSLRAGMLDRERSARIRALCADIIGTVVPAGTALLRDLLVAGAPDEADLAAWGLRFLHDRGPTELQLGEMLRSDDLRARARGARALRYANVDLSHCPPEVVSALRDPDADIRVDALRLLSELADVGLQRYGVDDVDGVRMGAEAALHDPDTEARACAAELLSLLDSSPDGENAR